MLLLEHIFVYAVTIFRRWEIANYGEQNANGVWKGKRETFLQGLQTFIDCIIVGFAFS